MKLDATMVRQTVDQFPAQPIPENHPVVPQLNQLFGDHTFFLDDTGLHIVEPTQPRTDGSQTGTVVKLASWSDASRTSLAPHEPQPSDVVVVLDTAA